MKFKHQRIFLISFSIFILLLNYTTISQTTKLWTERYFGNEKLESIPTFSISKLGFSQTGHTTLDAIDENNIIMVDRSLPIYLDSSNLAYEYLVDNNVNFGYTSTIKKSTDGGVNWITIFPRVYDNYTCFSITIAQYVNKDWIFFSGITAYQRNLSELYSDYDLFPSITFTSNGGKTWNIKKLDTVIDKSKYTTVYSLKMIDSLNGFAVIGSSNSYSILQTSNCWDSFKLIYFVGFDSTLYQGISSFDIYNTGNLDSILIAFSDKRNFALYSTNSGKNVSSFKFNNHKIEQVVLLSRDNYLVLATDSSVVNPKDKILKGSQKIYITYDRGDNWKLFYKNDTNQLIKKVVGYNENNISIISSILYPFVPWKYQLFQTSDGGISWEEQDITSVNDCLYIDSNKQYVFGTYTRKGLVNFNASPIIYFTKNNKALKRPSIKINNKVYPNDNLPLTTKPKIEGINCLINWNKIEGADKYKLKIFGEHSTFWLGLNFSFQASKNLKGYDYTSDYTTMWYNPIGKYNWKEHNVIEIVTTDTMFNFSNIWRNMVYGIEVTATNKATNLTSAKAFLSFYSDTSLLSKPEVIEPKSQSIVSTKDVLLKWLPVENAKTYNLIVWTDKQTRQAVIYDLFLRVKDINLTEYLLRDLDPNKDYSFAISASNDYDISEWRIIPFNTSAILSVSPELNNLTIFPNPARSTTRISLQQEGDISISAIDVLGRSYPLWSGFVSAGDKELDVSSLPTGAYTLLINYGTRVETVRLIKN